MVQEAKQGSGSAQGALFEAMLPDLRRYLQRKVGRKLGRAVSISDVAQESFMRSFDALQHLPEGAGIDDFRGILYKNAQWLLGKAARKNQNFQGESALGSPLPASLPSRAAHHSAGDVTRRDQRGWLQRQIERLNPEDANVLRMRGQGKSFEEIAGELDISLAAAKKRCLRASKRLRTLLEAQQSRSG